MTIERDRHHDDSGAGDEAPTPPRHRPNHLEDLQRRAEQHGQAARDAIARIAACANPELLLQQLKNQGGQ